MSKKHVQTSFKVESVQDVSFTTQAALSAAIPDYVDTVRLLADQDVRVAFVPASTTQVSLATTQGTRLVADQSEYFTVSKCKVEVITEDGASSGTLNISHMSQ